MGTVNGWRTVGGGVIGEWRFQPMGKMGKDVCPNFLQPLLENFDRRSCNDGSRELIPIFNNPDRKGHPSTSAAARTLEYLVGVPSRTAMALVLQ